MIDKTHKDFIAIRKTLEPRLGLLQTLANFRFSSDNVDQEAIIEFAKRIKSNDPVLKKLPKGIHEYCKFEHIIDDLIRIEREIKARKVFNEFPRGQKNLIRVENDFEILIAFGELPNNRELFAKISRYKSRNDLLTALQAFVAGSRPYTYTDVMREIKYSGLEKNIIYKNSRKKIVVMKVMSNYEICKVASDTAWCIVASSCTFNSYVPNILTTQLVIFLTDKLITDPERKIGVTIGPKGYVTAHIANDRHCSLQKLKEILIPRDFDIDNIKIDIDLIRTHVKTTQNVELSQLLNLLSFKEIESDLIGWIKNGQVLTYVKELLELGYDRKELWPIAHTIIRKKTIEEVLKELLLLVHNKEELEEFDYAMSSSYNTQLYVIFDNIYNNYNSRDRLDKHKKIPFVLEFYSKLKVKEEEYIKYNNNILKNLIEYGDSYYRADTMLYLAKGKAYKHLEKIALEYSENFSRVAEHIYDHKISSILNVYLPKSVKKIITKLYQQSSDYSFCKNLNKTAEKGRKILTQRNGRYYTSDKTDYYRLPSEILADRIDVIDWAKTNRERALTFANDELYSLWIIYSISEDYEALETILKNVQIDQYRNLTNIAAWISELHKMEHYVYYNKFSKIVSEMFIPCPVISEGSARKIYDLFETKCVEPNKKDCYVGFGVNFDLININNYYLFDREKYDKCYTKIEHWNYSYSENLLKNFIKENNRKEIVSFIVKGKSCKFKKKDFMQKVLGTIYSGITWCDLKRDNPERKSIEEWFNKICQHTKNDSKRTVNSLLSCEEINQYI